jgi:heme/copper-type cytochrome/quinol oxidase subunit 4
MNSNINKVGFVSGLLAFFSTIAFVIVQLLQLYRILYFPMDEILIYATSLCIVIPFVLEFLALHYITPDEKKFWSHAALIFSIIYAVFVTSNYVVQLATVIPKKISGSSNEIHVLEQTPHSLFWDYDALGYIFMGFATLIAIPALEKKGFQRWVRLAFLANAFVTPLISIVYFYPTYSEKLLILGFPWGITAPLAMLLLALLFKKNYTSYLYNKK